MTPERQIAYRKQVAALMGAVLADEISPRTALNSWPMFCNADPSVQCAYTMLWYREGDEERLHEEMYYADAQLQLLQSAYVTLQQGLALPLELIDSYRRIKAPDVYTPRETFGHPLGCIKYYWKRWNQAIETMFLQVRFAVNLKTGNQKGPSTNARPFENWNKH